MPKGSPGYFSKTNWGSNTRKYATIIKTVNARRWTDILGGVLKYTAFSHSGRDSSAQAADDESLLRAPDSGMFLSTATASPPKY
jgi:hypothetical protein